MSNRFRSFCFTLNNYTEEDVSFFRELDCKYLVCGREVGEEGTPHLQGFIHFSQSRHFSAIRKLHARWHLEGAKGTAEQNREYCTKQGDYFETGVQPVSSKRKGEDEKERWQDAWKKAKEGDIEGIDADIRFRSYTTIKQIAKDYMPKPEDLSVCENEWVYGPPGVGKSRSRRILWPGAYFKQMNKWWDGYQDEETVIIDDFELDSKLGHHLKIWGDMYSFIAEVKGGAKHIRPKRIIVTSNYSIEECFPGDLQLQGAIKRRFKVVHIPYALDFSVPDPVVAPPVVEDEEPSIDFGIWDSDVFEV